jgi:hypothetical protein
MTSERESDTDMVVTLENQDLQVAVMAQNGGRIISLRGRRDDRQWLSGPRANSTSPGVLGDVFTETDHFGWDEMLPTVDPCRYGREPYVDVEMADHGELWTAPWEVLSQNATSLHQRVRGRRLSYTFERRVELRGAVVRCEYWCETPVDTAMLWALHPQFELRELTRLHLHPAPSKILDTSRGEVRDVAWEGDVNLERDVPLGEDRMLYVEPGTRVDAVSLTDGDGAAVTMTWDTTFAPYLGIWADRGRYSAGRVIAIEPTNGFFDELTRALENDRVTIFRAHRPLTWWVEIEVHQREEK